MFRSAFIVGSAALTASNGLSWVYPVWHNNFGTTYLSESSPIFLKALPNNDESEEISQFSTTITNLKPNYKKNEVANFRLFTRNKNFKHNIFSSVVAEPETNIIEDAYFKIFRLIDNVEAIPYGTGTVEFTKLSYDSKGNYFNFNIALLEPGYTYGIKFLYRDLGTLFEMKEVHKFKIEE